MKLRAHANVIDLAEERRARQRRAAARMQFVGWRAAVMLTPYEIAALRQRAKADGAYFRKALAHLRPTAANSTTVSSGSPIS
jgi:hypothetical protein